MRRWRPPNRCRRSRWRPVLTRSFAKVRPPTKQRSEKWLASQTLILTSKDFAVALGAIGTLQSKGLTVEGLGFDIAPGNPARSPDSLTAEALAALRARADRIATTMEMAVTRYKMLQVGNATKQGGPPMPVRMMATELKF